MSEVREKATLAKAITPMLGTLSTAQKNEALRLMAEALVAETDSIIQANAVDLERGKTNGLAASMLDRLSLNPARIAAIAEGLKEIIILDDPIGDLLEEFARPNGLLVRKVRVPLGLIGIIYEARPNVTVDAAGLCLKSGNAVLLRGGSDALSSNKRIVEVLHSALALSDIPVDALQLVTNPDRASVDEMLKLNGLLDVVIPRGGHSLIQNVVKNATVPVIETGAGICHTYADNDADPVKALRIAINAKAQRPSVCNSMETLLLQEDFAERHLQAFAKAFAEVHVELRGSANVLKLIPEMKAATSEDWATEYNDYILNVKIVADLDEALAHIRQYGTMHSECIVTENAATAEKFMQQIDAAAVYHNASTRFTDGYEFGFGAEIGISTQKLHARGPMGLPALTSTKYYVHGNGQIRQ
ncbi:glutamate-5-semialdehyde dehydrogenase [Paenibacillus psychroresistens]|uniref:Gamma-glutamyl phosphate reductase n=1 Tax=Paenibacillus psychroresistens TaxID=1778678 RepID=A0A6B8RMQ2_9BACL|nr:glutamate-5-semialdehyde dehydrogenase [Paenibacillus psychroresistens]QGQ96823.1 glutamate-5-semialdehyde dehydrogenase [Paenibacillus psychroresistens]